MPQFEINAIKRLAMPNIPLFLMTSVAVTIAPGPDNIQVLARGISQGRGAGLVAASGFSAGLMFHTTLAALGIASILASSPMTFNIIKFVGAAYLIFLGAKSLRGGGTLILDPQSQQPLRKIFCQSVISNILNPKVTLFFMMFLPQFVDQRSGHAGIQMAVLGTGFMLQTIVVFSLFGTFAGFLGDRMRRWPAMGKWLERLAGVIFVGLGFRIALLS
jgi:threonine/homoserine/homoserine lactone efflux protein